MDYYYNYTLQPTQTYYFNDIVNIRYFYNNRNGIKVFSNEVFR